MFDLFIFIAYKHIIFNLNYIYSNKVKKMKLIIKKNKGFTLTEILLVLVVAAAIVISAFIIYPKVQSSERVKNEVATLSYIKAGVSGLYASSASVPAGQVNTKFLYDVKILPDNLVSKNGSTVALRSAFGGTVDITSSYFASYGFSAMTFTYNDFPVDSCVRFVSAAYPLFEGVAVGGNSVKDKMFGDGDDFSVAKASTECARTGTQKVTITLQTKI